MKKKAIQFVPLGRPARIGEAFRFGKDSDHYFREYTAADDAKVKSGEWASTESVERREVEVEVEDAVPEWIESTVRSWRDAMVELRIQKLAEAYRAHVEERVRQLDEALTCPGFNFPADVVKEMLLR